VGRDSVRSGTYLPEYVIVRREDSLVSHKNVNIQKSKHEFILVLNEMFFLVPSTPLC